MKDNVNEILDRCFYEENFEGAKEQAKADLLALIEEAERLGRLNEVDMAREMFVGNAHNQALKLREHLGNRYMKLKDASLTQGDNK